MYDTAERLMAGDLIIVPVSSGRHRKDDDSNPGDMYMIVNPPRDHNPSQVIIDLEDMWSKRTAQLIIQRFEIVEITRVWA